MLCLSSNNVFSTFLVEMSGTFDAQIVGFRCTTGKDDFFGRTSADEGSDLTSGLFCDALGFPTKSMCSRVGISVGPNLQGMAQKIAWCEIESAPKNH